MLSERQLFFRHLAQTSDFPLALEIVAAEGLYLTDKKGKRYLDLISGIGVSNVGHRHPKVVQAVKDQADRFMHLMVYGEYVQYPQVKLAEALVKKLPPTLDNVYLTNSGTEAIEGALKLAKRFTGRSRLISFRDTYHGSTHGALSIMGNEAFKNAFRPLLPDCLVLDYNQWDSLALIDQQAAVVVVEGVQGEAGYRTPHKAWMQALRQRCTDMGVLLLVDDIQAGMGRTGDWFSFTAYDIVPDIITLAKGLGGGMPIGAFISSREVMASLKSQPILGHITTFGGNPVCAAAALAVVEVIETENLLAGVVEKSALFRELLKHPLIRNIHGRGLMLAVDLDSFEQVQKVIQYVMDKGLITDWFLFNSHSLRIAPPLTITDTEIRWACQLLCEALDVLKES
jgi:acetylornithine/succinyldiaminopimelate/putrescine aminotransferase